MRHIILPKKLKLLLITVLLLLCQFPIMASQSDIRTVRVGFFPLANFNEYDSSGYRTGYNYEFIMKIQELTLWNIEFVDASNWPTALSMLENHEIDLLAPGQITEERKEKFIFSEYETGIEYGSFLTQANRDDLIYDDYEGYAELTFGCVDSSIFRDDFESIAETYQYNGDVVWYSNSSDMLKGLDEGEIDIAVANLMQQSKNDYKLLAKFSPSSQYYMSYKGNEEFMDELNQALLRLRTEYPEFESNLINIYYPSYTSLPFDKYDYEYINKNYTLNVAITQNYDPISYLDENGELQGISVKLLNTIAEKSGLHFNYIVTNDKDIDDNFLYENQIDLIANTEYNTRNASINTLKLTYPYYDGKKILVAKSHLDFSTEDTYRLGIIETNDFNLSFIQNQYPNFTIIEYESDEECLEAVNNEEIDLFLQNRYVLERYLLKPRYSNLVIIDNENIENKQSLALVLYKDANKTINEKTYDTRLSSILNKVILTLSTKEVNDIIISETTARPYHYTFNDFIDRYYQYLIMLIIVSLIILVLVIYVIILKNRNLRIMKENEEKLHTIINNTNAGIISLQRNKGIIIEEANEGLLRLLHIDKQDLKKENAVVLDPKSIESINKLLDNPPINSQIKIQLKILYGNNYIETLFIGTLTKNSNNYILYAVAVDISEQQNLIYELESQQNRYTLLMKKSDSIMFDYSLITKTLTIDPKFQKQFGWSYANETIQNSPDVWEHIHPNDRKILISMFSSLVKNEEEDAHCRIRLYTNELNVVWCDIAGYVMKSNNRPTSIIGTIKDVSAEVNEQVNLRRQARLDALTGLLNKQAFYEESTQYLINNKYRPSAVIFLDIDNFKSVNDALGHMAGDQAIIDTATKIQKIFANIDIISRFGGDEFCIFVKDISKRTLTNKLNWTLEKLSTIYSDGTKEIAVTTSIGVAIAPNDGVDIHTLLTAADKALYYSKENGKNQYTFYDESLELNRYQGRNKE